MGGTGFGIGQSSSIITDKSKIESSNEVVTPLLSRSKGTAPLSLTGKTGNLQSSEVISNIGSTIKSLRPSDGSPDRAVKLSSIPTGKMTTEKSSETASGKISKPVSLKMDQDGISADGKIGVKTKSSATAKVDAHLSIADNVNFHAKAHGSVAVKTHAKASGSATLDSSGLVVKASASVGATVKATGSAICDLSIGGKKVADLKVGGKAEVGATADATAVASFTSEGFALSAEVGASFGKVSGSATVGSVGVEARAIAGVSFGGKISSKGIDIDFLCFGISLKW